VRPVAEVFAAVTDPQQLSAYFTTGGASAALAEGATVIWKFGDYPGEFPVRVTRLVPNQRIEFSWDAEEGADQTAVVMTFEAPAGGGTLVRVVENGWRQGPEGLKAWLEHGINLRQGFF
jgi:uncharacterized protein YndB with AHSA1/START domain